MATAEFVALIFNGALTLAGILLVFIGFIYSQAATFPAETAIRITRRYKIVAKLGLIPFSLAIILAMVAFEGLNGSPGSVKDLTTFLFWIELTSLLVYGIVSVFLFG